MASTDDMYNAASRRVQCKIEIYFGYDRIAPWKQEAGEVQMLTVYPHDYLMDMQVLEEICSAEAEPWGRCTSNELSFTLYSPDRMFDPANTSGEYSSRVRSGMMCKVYVEPDATGASWDPLGVFYVTEWRVNVLERTVSAVAHDALYFFLLGEGHTSGYGGIVVNGTVGQYISETLSYNGITATVVNSTELQQPVKLAASYTDYADTLSSALTAGLSACFCDHNGTCIIGSWRTPRGTRAALTDADQIISVVNPGSALTAYSTVRVPMYTPFESEPQVLCTTPTVQYRANKYNSVRMPLFNVHPILRVTDITTVSSSPVIVSSVDVQLKTASLFVEATDAGEAVFSLRGTTIEYQASDSTEASADAFTVDSTFVQTDSHQASILSVARQYVACATPTYTLRTRGNPLLSLGDTVEVSSAYYGVSFVGVIARQRFTYNGALSCEMLLVNTTAIVGA